ncbi:MAG TPA: alkaline phosphatase family protein, partial [Bacteroidia bacterium]|nr:alkaline phosphatase family protein [Bacteroidia bacterium]
ILNEKRAGFPVICGGDSCGGANPDEQEHLLNSMKRDSYTPFGTEEYLDVFTHYFALDFLMKKKPRVLYISYGETDEWAHSGHYHDYLDAAHHVDQWLSDIWNFLQNNLQYKNRTALFVTVDHGRGDVKKEQWTSHNNKIADSHQIWFAVMGPGIPARGEIKTAAQIYQKQFAQTFAQLLGLTFTCEHPVGNGLKDVLMK